MKTPIQIACNAVVAKLFNADRQAKNLVSELLSFSVEGAEFMSAFKSGSWNGRSSFFSYDTCSFPAGFVIGVEDALKKAGYTVHVVKKKPLEPLGPENPIVDSFGNDDERYDYQIKALKAVEKHGRGIIQVATGGGKCLGRDTPILMFDGTIKLVQDITVGDRLMGPDSTPRHVLSTCSGVDPLYRITPKKGDSYVVNDAHILSLKKTGYGRQRYSKGEIVNINVLDYLAKTNTFKHTHKGWRTGVNFPIDEKLTVDPYFVGLLLGDGSINSTVSLTTADVEIVTEIEKQAAIWDLKVTSYSKTQSDNTSKTYYMTAGRTGGKPNALMLALRDYGFGKNAKFIPHAYRTASREDRLALLAGILDTDGFYDGKCFYLTLKNERLMDDVIFVARSLGFAAYKKPIIKRCYNNGVEGKYFTTIISGSLDQIPVRLKRRRANPRMQKKDPLVTGLTVESIGKGEYFGFEIDGDHLFMLGDFTVTHNTKIAKLIVARYRRPTLFVTTRGVLMYQMKDGFEEAGLNVGVLGDGEWKPVRGVNVAMVQTLVARVQEPDFHAEVREVIRQISSKEIELDKTQIQALAKKRFEEKTLTRAKTLKLLEMFEVVIGEEAHEAGGESYFNILKYCRNAEIRVALTATPFMRTDMEDNMRLMAAFGPKLITVTEKLLIERGILATPYFKFAQYEPHHKLRRSSPWQRAYQLGIVESPGRNQSVVEHAKKAVENGLSVMVLVQRKSHGDHLKKMLLAAGLKVEFIRGENDQEGRQKALTKLKTGKTNVLIGTTILDVGVDVPAVGMVINAGGGKAEVALRQRIGRGLRAKKGAANVCFILDFCDEVDKNKNPTWVDRNNNYLKEHYRQRRQIITDTPGFSENILDDGKDFDWSLLSKK